MQVFEKIWKLAVYDGFDYVNVDDVGKYFVVGYVVFYFVYEFDYVFGVDQCFVVIGGQCYFVCVVVEQVYVEILFE